MWGILLESVRAWGMFIKSQRCDVGKMKHYWSEFWQKCVFTFEPVPVPNVENRENFYLATH